MPWQPQALCGPPNNGFVRAANVEYLGALCFSQQWSTLQHTSCLCQRGGVDNSNFGLCCPSWPMKRLCEFLNVQHTSRYRVGLARQQPSNGPSQRPLMPHCLARPRKTLDCGSWQVPTCFRDLALNLPGSGCGWRGKAAMSIIPAFLCQSFLDQARGHGDSSH